MTDKREWAATSSDPMDPRLIERRQQLLDAVRRAPISDRTGHLRSLARGRRVLDVGVVDHSSATDRRDDWLHGELAAVAKESLGIDILEDELAMLDRQGFAVACMDLTAGDRPEGSWDLIVAGELVEHLGNPGGIFDAAAELLSDDGIFILSTPNPFAGWRIAQNLRGRPHENVDHALLISGWGIVEFCERSGLRLLATRGVWAPTQGRASTLFARAVRRRWLPVLPEAACETVIYEMTRA